MYRPDISSSASSKSVLYLELDMSTTEAKSLLSSAETIGNNHDILTEILLRMPALSLLSLKFVSKQWLSIISDPKFHASYNLHQQIWNPKPTPNALLLNNYYSSTPEFELVPLKDNPLSFKKVPFLDYLNVPRVKILQSCNGLLLCSSTYLLKASEQKWKRDITYNGVELVKLPSACYEDYCQSVVTDEDCGFRFFVCNPTTRQFKRIPLPPYVSNSFDVLLVLAFDPLKSPCYKVICIHELEVNARRSHEIDVYSSETESWHMLHISFQRPRFSLESSRAFCYGAVHCYNNRTRNSFCFDVNSLKWKVVPVPHQFWPLEMLYFGESRGHLHMVMSKDKSTLEFDVLEMKSDCSGWFLRYHVDLHFMRMLFSDLVWHRKGKSAAFSVLSVIRPEKEEESTVVLFVDGRALSFNLYNGTMSKLLDLEPRLRVAGFDNGAVLDYESRDAHQYFEALFSV